MENYHSQMEFFVWTLPDEEYAQHQRSGLQYLMEHSEIGVMLNTYTHLGVEDAVDEIKKMEEERARQEIERGDCSQRETRLTQRMFRVV